ncbi:hypothetical protein RJ640_009445 [Escallonia rubra]|uniref:Uncharacterized protein n=1 Tax=Escallonia rubra TaxID=112253 RepID=A0AA88R7L7_9ASTE|nr:hypothetical protein RJ640_009445 [Escallonia rubra]
MELSQNGIEFEFDFWPIQHPVEPMDEDRPVKCPIPHPHSSSAVNKDGGMHEQFSESLRKRADLSAVVKKERMMLVAAESPVRVVRKRHHTLTRGGDHTITPLAREPPLYPHPPQNVTILDMSQ